MKRVRNWNGHAVPLQPARPGTVAREDDAFTRGGGTAYVLLSAPHRGWTDVVVTGRRTVADFAHVIWHLVDDCFPEAERIVLVLDNLNTHGAQALYQTFAPAEAWRLWQKLEGHDTPKHGSWLNIAELELRGLNRQCLDQRFADRPAFETAVAEWVAAHNAAPQAVRWHFTTADACIRLHQLYPVITPTEPSN